MNVLKNKKFRYGSVSVALTVAIIAAVILLNAIVTALVSKYNLYLDMTREQLFTLSGEAKTLLDPLKESDRRVKVIFCAPKDEVMADGAHRYALQTVEDIESYLGESRVVREHIDIFTNPSAVQKYFEGESTVPSSYNIILVGQSKDAAGEWVDGYSQVYTLQALFTYDSAGSSIIGYNGEQRLVSGMLSVTQTEQPIACFTSNHGEFDSLPANSSLELLLEDNGFKVQKIDLQTEEIPEDCSLMVIYNPTVDFVVNDGVSRISEIDKIEKFLHDENSLMVFMNSKTGLENGVDGRLPNLEDYLAQWGIGIARKSIDGADDVNYIIEESSDHSFDPDGYVNVAEYITGGLGASLTSKLLSASTPKKVLFPASTALVNTYGEYKYYEDGGYFEYRYDGNMTTRRCYDVFVSSDKAVAKAGGAAVEDAKAPYSYMKLTRETLAVGENDTERYSYVLACASTDFVNVPSNYGNHSVLARACHEMGATKVAVSIDPKYFTDTEIDNITSGEANTYTVVLAVVPASLIFIAGIYIMVRRKYR